MKLDYSSNETSTSSNEAPTSSRSIYLREIHRQIDHSQMLQRLLAHSTRLLFGAERIAMGEENAPAQAVRPLAPALPAAPIPPLDWRKSAQASALAPLGGECSLSRSRDIRYIFSTLF